MTDTTTTEAAAPETVEVATDTAENVDTPAETTEATAETTEAETDTPAEAPVVTAEGHLNIQNMLGTPMGSVLSTALRALLAGPDNRDMQIDLANLKIEIKLNDREVPLPRFITGINSEAQFVRMRTQIRALREELTNVRRFVSENTAEGVAQRVIDAYTARIQEVNLAEVCQNVDAADFRQATEQDIIQRLDAASENMTTLMNSL